MRLKRARRQRHETLMYRYRYVAAAAAATICWYSTVLRDRGTVYMQDEHARSNSVFSSRNLYWRPELRAGYIYRYINIYIYISRARASEPARRSGRLPTQ